MKAPQSPIIIAIDGHSSTGKSSFAKAIATALGYIYVDTGAMYRAVSLYALQKGFIAANNSINEQALYAALPEIHISFRSVDGLNTTFLNGVNVEREIRELAVSQLVSAVSALAVVRAELVRLQQEMGKDKGLVMDGRDIGTVVFPQAEIKIFMTADPRVRAERRYKELQAKGSAVSFDEILKNVVERDHADETRAVTPLRRADDALLLDNSHMTPAEQMAWFEKLITNYELRITS